LAISTANVGVGAQLTARGRVVGAGPAVTVGVCETVAATGQCKAAPGAGVTRVVGANETATWAAFITASGAVGADPAHNRVFFEFVDTQGVVRGSTSTAVTTQ
jgi:hypothetical protein